MKKGLIITAIVAALMLCFTSCDWHVQKDERGDAAITTRAVDSVPMLILQIQKCARLYTAEYKVHKIITHSDQLKLKVLSPDYAWQDGTLAYIATHCDYAEATVTVTDASTPSVTPYVMV